MHKENTHNPIDIPELDRSPMKGGLRDFVVLSLADAETDHPSFDRPHVLLSIGDRGRQLPVWSSQPTGSTS